MEKDKGEFKNQMECPPCIWTLEGKHIAMKEPNKSGSEYYNYNYFFSLILLALVKTEYRFLLIESGSSGSCSDKQIFNRRDSGEQIEDGSLGLPAPEPLWDGGPELHYFMPGVNT